MNISIFFITRMFDFIDSGTMEGLQHNLLQLTESKTLGSISDRGDLVHLKCEVVARRKEPDGTIRYLIRYHPRDVVPDEWLTEKEFQPIKKVPIRSLDAEAMDVLIPLLFPHLQNQQPHQKHRRKPMKKT